MTTDSSTPSLFFAIREAACDSASELMDSVGPSLLSSAFFFPKERRKSGNFKPRFLPAASRPHAPIRKSA
jgi:hypothetical protein